MAELDWKATCKRRVASIPPLSVMSVALLIVVVLLGPVGSPEVAASSRQPDTFARVSQTALAQSRDIGTPGWWQGGVCDPSNDPASHILGASWHGLVACGPGPTQGGGDHEVAFFPGAWGELEWECVELSMRWMYLAWGVNPYPADGWDVVRNYNVASIRAKFNPGGPPLVAVNNGTVGAVPQPGDVVSLGQTRSDSFGHTAVVTANAVDARGNGTITLIEQNGGAGSDGWVTYRVNDWVVSSGVTGWLHNPSWTYQRPLVAFTGPTGFEARVAGPGTAYGVVATGASSIAVSGYAGAGGVNGDALYGYIDQAGDFFVKRGSSTTWNVVAQHAKSIALATTESGTPVLGFLSTSGNFYVEEGSLTRPFTLQATGVSSIALAAGGGTAPPLLGYLRSKDAAFLVKAGLSASTWTVVQTSGVRAIALAEGTTPSSGVMAYLSSNGRFFASQVSRANRWTKEASDATAISLAAVGPAGQPLLGYLARNSFYVAEGLAPSAFTKEATGVTEIAVASAESPGSAPVLGYVTTAGNLEAMQGQLFRRFSLQARGVSTLAISSVTDS